MATDDTPARPPSPEPSRKSSAVPSGSSPAGRTPADAGGQSAPTPRPSGTRATDKSTTRKVDLATDSRTARAWAAWIVGAIVLIFLLIFIIQNSDSADFQLFTWHFSLPLGVAILLAGIAGALITALLGAARMLQMRRAARKHR